MVHLKHCISSPGKALATGNQVSCRTGTQQEREHELSGLGLLSPVFIIWPRKPETMERMVKALYLLLKPSLRMSLLGPLEEKPSQELTLWPPMLVSNRANSVLPRHAQPCPPHGFQDFPPLLYRDNILAQRHVGNDVCPLLIIE